MNNSISSGYMTFKKHLRRPLRKSGEIVRDMIELTHTLHQLIFMTLLMICAHKPCHIGKNTYKPDIKNPEENFNNQVKSVEYTDKELTCLFKAFEDRLSKIHVMITSDNNEYFDWCYEI